MEIVWYGPSLCVALDAETGRRSMSLLKRSYGSHSARINGLLCALKSIMKRHGVDTGVLSWECFEK